MSKYRLMGTTHDVEAERFEHGAPGTPRQKGVSGLVNLDLSQTGRFFFRDDDFGGPRVPIHLGDFIVRPPNGVPYVLNPVAFHSLFIRVDEETAVAEQRSMCPPDGNPFQRRGTRGRVEPLPMPGRGEDVE